LGNLASRLTAMLEKYCETKVPAPGEYLAADQLIIDLLAKNAKAADAAIDNFEIATAITLTKEVVDAVNLYVTEQAPWVLAKDPANLQRLNTVLYVIAEALRAIAVLHHPVMPIATEKLWEMLGASALGELAAQQIATAGNWGQLPVGAITAKTESLFPRLAEDA
jgi:methionyl-tRNA synthetase